MNKKHKKEVIVVLSILACVLMCGVEKILQPNFFHKSLYKILIFSLSVLLYALYAKEKIKIFAWKEINKKFLRKILGLVFFIYVGILIGYVLIQHHVEPELIKQSLWEKEKINGDNFIYVFFYISFINSFLEEFFFRGYIFGKLKEMGNLSFAYMFSALLFALYHISIIDSWFSPTISLYMILGLMVVGLFFDFLMQRAHTFAAPWFIHIAANLSINTVTMMILKK